jgi:hypothetical protein
MAPWNPVKKQSHKLRIKYLAIAFPLNPHVAAVKKISIR